MVLPGTTLTHSELWEQEALSVGHQKRHKEETSFTSESHTTLQAEETGKDEDDGPVLTGGGLSDVNQTQQ